MMIFMDNNKLIKGFKNALGRIFTKDFAIQDNIDKCVDKWLPKIFASYKETELVSELNRRGLDVRLKRRVRKRD